MNRLPRILVGICLACALTVVASGSAAEPEFPTRPDSGSDSGSNDVSEQVATLFAELLKDAIPLEYERQKDWGKTKRIPVGVKVSGHGLRLRISKRKKDVKHGVWKHYRVTMIEPEKYRRIRIENLRHLGPGRIGLTLRVVAKVHVWTRVKVYNRGVHVIGLTAEGDTTFDLAIDCEIGVRIEAGDFLADVVVDPVVTDSRLALRDFHLTRVGELHGPVIRELGDELRRVVEDELRPAKLTKKLNCAIDKKRDRLRFSVGKLLPEKKSN